jgi:hypothetical protein
MSKDAERRLPGDGGMIILGAIFLLLLMVNCQTAPQEAPQVFIHVDTTNVAHVMRGGIGASWHAIEEPIPVVGTRSHGGSAWGGHPPAEEEQAWQQIYRHAAWLGLNFSRVELEQRMYQPERDRFTFDTPEMRILYRILDYCQSHDVDVILQQMWGNVDWNAFPEWRGDPLGRLHSGPYSMEAFAEGLATLVEHLARQRGYTCIKWVCINNEPGHDWSWWQKPPNEPMSITPGLEAVRRAMDKRGIAVPLVGPDWTDLPELEPEKIDFDPFIGAYDIHSYYARFDWMESPGYPLSQAEERLADWVQWAHSRNKPLFLSELGTMALGWGGSDPNPGSYLAGLKDAQLVLRGLAVGVDGFNRWSFVNRGDLDGQWQLIDTWDADKGQLMTEFLPHPNAYYLYGLLSRFTAKYSSILTCTTSGGVVDGIQRVFAQALRSPRGHLTVFVLNDADRPWRGTIELQDGHPDRLYKYQVNRDHEDRTEVRIEPLQEIANSARITDEFPAFSLTVFTSYRKAADDPGTIVD